MDIVRELGKNVSGGRITYLAKDSDRLVVVKKFKFMGDSWDDYKAIEREAQILKSLNHSQIPKYLDSYQGDDGYCLVQEYIDAEPLSIQRSLTIDQVRSIARQTLEILIYLQSLNPPVLHRDIKPENILYDGTNVYLVDFGFSRLGGDDVALSSVMVGTMGFIPPELFAGREPTKASDLYSLGATLLSLASGKPSTKIAELMGDDFSFSQSAFTDLPHDFSVWLKRMVAPRLSDRFTDAQEALSSLNELDQGQGETDGEYEEYSSKIAARLRRNTENAYSKLQFNPNSVLANVRYRQAVRAEDKYHQRFPRKRTLQNGSYSYLVNGEATIPPGNHRGRWENDSCYQIGDRISYKRFSYFAVRFVPSNTPPPDPEFWRVTVIAPRQQNFWLKPWHLYPAYLGVIVTLFVIFSGISSSNPQLIQSILGWMGLGGSSSTQIIENSIEQVKLEADEKAKQGSHIHIVKELTQPSTEETVSTPQLIGEMIQRQALSQENEEQLRQLKVCGMPGSDRSKSTQCILYKQAHEEKGK